MAAEASRGREEKCRSARSRCTAAVLAYLPRLLPASAAELFAFPGGRPALKIGVRSSHRLAFCFFFSPPSGAAWGWRSSPCASPGPCLQWHRHGAALVPVLSLHRCLGNTALLSSARSPTSASCRAGASAELTEGLSLPSDAPVRTLPTPAADRPAVPTRTPGAEIHPGLPRAPRGAAVGLWEAAAGRAFNPRAVPHRHVVMGLLKIAETTSALRAGRE